MQGGRGTMTPLAHEIARQALLPQRRKYIADMFALVKDAHCFELTDVFELVFDLTDSYLKLKSYDHKLAFLPAPVTWIEYRPMVEERFRNVVVNSGLEERFKDPQRLAHRLTETDDVVCEHTFMQHADGTIHYTYEPLVFNKKDVFIEGHERAIALFAMLAMINHPKVIGRRQHMPHRGLERQLVRSLGAGKFPLHAWTEIKLHVMPTRDMRDDPSVEAHYTGHKALHFCRAHLRLRGGRLEFVRAHWRGDPAIGIKQSRYRVVPPNRAVEVVED
jgi:hypothetical protein